MKKYQYLIAASLMAVSLGSCSDDNDALTGQGSIVLQTSVNYDVKVAKASRADLSDELGSSLVVWISNEKGLIRRYNGASELPQGEIPLLSGHYVAEAWAGDSVSASFDTRWFKGYVPFDVTAGQVTNVAIECKIANVVASVNYAADVDEVLTDYTFTVSHARGSLTFTDRDVRKGYFMMPSTDKDLHWMLNGKKKSDGSAYQRSGVVSAVQPAHEYIFNISCASSDEALGGGFLDITVDDTMVDVDLDPIIITLPPEIRGVGYDITKPVTGVPGGIGRKSVFISCASTLESVLVECDKFASVLGISGNDFNLMTMTDAVKQELNAKGINWEYKHDATADISTLKLNFEAELTNSLAVGDYDIAIEAVDGNGKTTTGALKISVTEAPIAISDVDASSIEFSHSTAVLEGDILIPADVDGKDVVIEYASKASRADWQSVTGTIQGNRFSVKLTGLVPGTTYQYKATVGTFTTPVKEFTTEPATQLPNSGFEDWTTASAPYLIYAPGGTMFWDSGNHGSATMSKNVTTPDNSVKHSGNYSIKLASQFVGVGKIGKFAAGNVFIGKYLDTQGTDGVLGWGRPFTGRPSKLAGYVQYKPAAVEYTSSSLPDLKKGDPDNGVVYIALLDETLQEYNGEKFPVIVKTKTSEFFDKNAANVIAYGESYFTAETNGMIRFEIPLEYFRKDVRPSYIVVVASASKGGDYFAGGPSTMWLDDLELVYE